MKIMEARWLSKKEIDTQKNRHTHTDTHTQALCYLECQLSYQTISGCSILDLERIQRKLCIEKTNA